MRKILFASLLACLVGAPAYAQNTQCDATTAFTIYDVTFNAHNECTQASGKKGKKALGRQISATRAFKDILGNDNANTLRDNFKYIRKNNCEVPTDLADCTDDTAFTVEEIRTALESGVCQAKQNSKRQNSIKKLLRGVKRIESLLDPTFYASLAVLIDELKGSNACAQGGVKQSYPTSCDREVDFRSGDLWKPYADVDGRPVFLIGQYGSVPGACYYVQSNNKVFAVLDNKGDSNGRAGTYRVDGKNDTTCGGFPKGWVRCNISGKDTCWEVKRPCDRIE